MFLLIFLLSTISDCGEGVCILRDHEQVKQFKTWTVSQRDPLVKVEGDAERLKKKAGTAELSIIKVESVTIVVGVGHCWHVLKTKDPMSKIHGVHILSKNAVNGRIAHQGFETLFQFLERHGFATGGQQ